MPMRDRDFEFWLENTYKTARGQALQKASVRNTLADCRLVEEYEGNLDEHYRRDVMKALLARFTYSRDEEARHIRPRHSIPLQGVDQYKGTMTRRSAINLYLKFCAAS